MPLSDYPNADSIQAGANVVAPGANTTIVSLGPPPAGDYEILFAAAVGAGAVAADDGNVKLAFNNADKILAVPTKGEMLRIPRVRLDGTNSILLKSVGAATAAVVYTGTLIATRIN